MSSEARCKIGPTSTGSVLIIEGRATRTLSPRFGEYVRATLDEAAATVVVDLSRCEYLDSTFVGSLLVLHRRYNAAGAPRFRLASPSPAARKVMAGVHLDRMLAFEEDAPNLIGAPVDLEFEPGAADPLDGFRHILASHQALRDLCPDNARVFGPICAQMEVELEKAARH